MMTQVSSRHGKTTFLNNRRDSSDSRRTILDKIGRLGILPAHEAVRRDSELWNRLTGEKQKATQRRRGYDASGLNILVSDPILEMYHKNHRGSNL